MKFSRIEADISRGIFDPEMGSVTTLEQVKTKITEGSKGTTSLQSHSNQQSLSYSKKSRNGTTFSTNYQMKWRETDPDITSINPSYDSSWKSSFHLPLKKGRGRFVNEYPINIARLNRDISKNRSLALIYTFIKRVKGYFLDFARELENIKLNRTSLKTAEELLDQTRVAYESGAGSHKNYIQAESGVFERRKILLSSRLNIEKLLIELEHTLSREEKIDHLLINTELFPVYLATDLRADFMSALQFDPIYQSLLIEVKKSGLALKKVRRDALSRLDLDGSLTLNGLSESGETSIQESLDSRYPSVKLSINYQFPLKKRAEKGRIRQQKIKNQKTLLEIRNRQNQILRELKKAHKEINFQNKLVTLGKESVKATLQQYQTERDYFQQGKSSSYDVLFFEERVKSARASLFATKISLYKSHLNLHILTGEILKNPELPEYSKILRTISSNGVE